MKNTKTQNGITLIALIITIIVLLILAVVAIASVTDSGIITYAEKATDESERAKEEEKLRLAMMEAQLAGNGKFSYELLDSNLPEGFSGSNGRYTSESGNIFDVSLEGNISTVEYLEGTNLRLNVKYYLSGKDTNYYHIFYSDGYAETTITDEAVRIKYIIEEDVVKYRVIDLFGGEDAFDDLGLDEATMEYYKNLYFEYNIVKEDNNDLLINEKPVLDNDANLLFGTSSSGLRYFNGEKYENGDRIFIFNNIGWEYREGNVAKRYNESFIPVFYNGVIYIEISDVITSTDNLETIINNGETYIKSEE